MSFTKEDIDTYTRNILKSVNTFKFSCKMCGQCCRNRSDPIIVTGVDICRIAKELNMTAEQVVLEKIIIDIGDQSNLPVAVLKERLDGSCSLLRNGKCMVQQNKPAVCALYPLGRMYNYQTKEYSYFKQVVNCPGTQKGKTWTISEWLDEFHIDKKNEEETLAWNKLICGLAMVTHNLIYFELEDVMDLMVDCMYIDYDTSKTYQEEVERNMIKLQAGFKELIGKEVKF